MIQNEFVYELDIDLDIDYISNLVLKKQDETEERRSGIINSILGAIGCLGLFSFLKDLLPFINDSQYQSYYKIFSVLLPIVIMVFILFFLNNSKKNNE